MALYRKFLKKCKTDFSKCLQDIYDTENDTYESLNSRIDSLNFYLYYFNENHLDTLNPLVLKTKECYCILKEQYTETWFFISKDLVVFYIKEIDFEDFYLSFVYSETYKMMIYKTEMYYIAFCVSHKSSDIYDIKRFLISNNNDIRLTILSYFITENERTRDECNSKPDITEETEMNMIYPNDLEYHGIVILNRDIFSYLDKKKYNLHFDSVIGYGCEIPELMNMIKTIQMYIDNNKYLPCHYLNLN